MKFTCLLGFCVCLGLMLGWRIAGAAFFGVEFLCMVMMEMIEGGHERAEARDRLLDGLTTIREQNIRAVHDLQRAAEEAKNDEIK